MARDSIELDTLPSTAATSRAASILAPSEFSTKDEEGFTPRSSAPVLGSSTDDYQPTANKEAFDSYPEDAWASCVLPCFVIFSTTIGGMYAWGVFQDKLVAEGVGSSSTLAWIGSTQACMEALLAIPASRLVAAYGPRRVALLSTFFTSLAPLLASFCTHSVGGLVVTEGILFGFGVCLGYFASAMLPSSYFLRRRNIATGLVFAGGGIGGAVFSIIAAQLLERMSLQWTFRTLALIYLLLNLPAALVLKSRLPKEPFRSEAKVLDWTRSSPPTRRSLFKDARFTLLLLGTSIALFPLFVPPFFLPLYGSSIGLSASTSSLILAGFNLASAGGRVGFGLGADAFFGSINSLVLCLALVGVSTLAIWPVATSMAPLIVFAVINGFCAGGMFSLIPGTVASVFGTKRLGTVFSLMVSFWTSGYFMGSPIAGYLLQAFGGPEGGVEAYRPAMFYSGALSLLAAICVGAVRVRTSRRVWAKI
ncbi:hypothetical protein JCM8097_000882 [Rhodosporidiobolus ruineniae]